MITRGYCGAENASCDGAPYTGDYLEVSWEDEDADTEEGVAADHEAIHDNAQEVEEPVKPPTPTAEQNADSQVATEEGSDGRTETDDSGASQKAFTPPLFTDSGISVVVWANGTGTRILGHVSYIIDGTSYSFDNEGYHPDPALQYIANSSVSSPAVMYDLDFGTEEKNESFKELIRRAYDKPNDKWTGVANNCSTAFRRAINGIGMSYGSTNSTPAGVQRFIEANLTPYIKGRVHIPRSKPE